MEVLKSKSAASLLANASVIERMLERRKEQKKDLTPKYMRLFVSSTFRDMVLERNAMHDLVFPALRHSQVEKLSSLLFSSLTPLLLSSPHRRI
jgi:hypothetical protein